jgi:hypothetical protein
MYLLSPLPLVGRGEEIDGNHVLVLLKRRKTWGINIYSYNKGNRGKGSLSPIHEWEFKT